MTKVLLAEAQKGLFPSLQSIEGYIKGHLEKAKACKNFASPLEEASKETSVGYEVCCLPALSCLKEA